MAAAFGGDPAATDAARVLRLPGFHNKKFGEPVNVKGHRCGEAVSHRGHFAGLPGIPGISRWFDGEAGQSGSRRDGRPLSQSERDWAWVCDQLRAGVAAETIERALAERRGDKHNPADYAERTVQRAIR